MERKTDVLIVGGGTGGLAAALAVARQGLRCILTEPTDWVGGQLTAQGVPADENRWIEGDNNIQAATRSYLDWRTRVRDWYKANRALTDAARNNPRLNPGNGWVSRICAEPAVIHLILQQTLAPHIAAGRIEILYHTVPLSADVAADRVRAVTVQNSAGLQTTISADYVLDATEMGDLLPLASAEYYVGAEHRDVHGELHGRTDKSDPLDVQAISWCFAVEHCPSQDHTLPKPAHYDFFRAYEPKLDRPWPGPLFSWTVEAVDDFRSRTFAFVPWPDEPAEPLDMWRYRRISDRSLYRDAGPSTPPDVSLINMVQMDYFQTPTLDVSPADLAAAFAAARQQSLCWLYWMQTQSPRHDHPTKLGYPGLRLRGQELGTTDGFAKHPYIRESRRLKARTMITEAHVGTEQRKKEGRPNQHVTPSGMSEPFPDSVGIGHYRLDLHPSSAFRAGFYIHSAPFRIPLGSLIPIRIRNLLAAAKNIGVTHITNGCYRLHPIEWNAGEAAGLLAAWCIKNKTEPHAVHADLAHTRKFQSLLQAEGIPLAWPWEENAGL